MLTKSILRITKFAPVVKSSSIFRQGGPISQEAGIKRGPCGANN